MRVPHPEEDSGGAEEAPITPPTVQCPGEGEEVVDEDDIRGIHGITVMVMMVAEERRQLERN